MSAAQGLDLDTETAATLTRRLPVKAVQSNISISTTRDARREEVGDGCYGQLWSEERGVSDVPLDSVASWYSWTIDFVRFHSTLTYLARIGSNVSLSDQEGTRLNRTPECFFARISCTKVMSCLKGKISVHRPRIPGLQ